MAESIPKVTLLQGATSDLSAATYQIHDESHTMGNSLRWMLMKNPKVEFCGYSVPHPSENVINVRIQMYDNLSSLDALIDALGNLDNLCEVIEDAYLDSLRENKHEVWIEES
ncbi:RNA polymerase subunit AC19 [Leucoagaricus gongylophorus]